MKLFIHVPIIIFLDAEEDDAPDYETPTTSNTSDIFMSLHSTEKVDGKKESAIAADQTNVQSEVKLLGKQTKKQQAKILRLKKVKGTVGEMKRNSCRRLICILFYN